MALRDQKKNREPEAGAKERTSRSRARSGIAKDGDHQGAEAPGWAQGEVKQSPLGKGVKSLSQVHLEDGALVRPPPQRLPRWLDRLHHELLGVVKGNGTRASVWSA